MKKIFFAVLIFCEFSFAQQIKDMPLDFSLRNTQLQQGQIAYGWEIMPWLDWLKRPTSGPLIIETAFNKNDIEVFEARAAAVINKPASNFTEAYLLNINTIKKLNPKNQHTLIPGPRFTVETIMPFPPAWDEIISVAKKTKLLADKTTGYIKIESAFAYASRKNIEDSVELKKIVRILDITGLPPEALSFQGSAKINQIADFISIVTVFYKLDERRTLIVCFTAAAIKKHILNMGISTGGLKLNGRSVLLGENSYLNSKDGIGAGLPKYFLEFFTNMVAGL